MGQILHKCATTTAVTRAKIIASKDSIQATAKQFGISPSTVVKWRKRGNANDLPMGNGRANSVLTSEEEQLICEARRRTWLPLDDLLDHLKAAIPNRGCA
jgi:transposase